MPIRESERARYPKDWRAISDAIRFGRAGGRCECVGECGLHDGGRRCVEEHRKPARYARGNIVLTVAHLNHTPEDCRPENLKAMCQRCHLRYDAAHHANTVRQRKHRAAEENGQLSIEVRP